MTWTAPAQHLADGPLTGPDRPILEGFLAWQRGSLLSICSGLTGEQLVEQSVPPSALSLLGLVRHMTKVERFWLRQGAAGEVVGALFDPALGRDADFAELHPDRAPEDFHRFEAECRLADAAVADLPLDHTFTVRGETFALRVAYVHLIAEYGRHNGHADLLRERIDGRTAT